MKKIVLKSIIHKEENTIWTNLKRYKIFVTWGKTNLFKNKKKAATFQAGLNTWINDTFYELNNIYANIQFIYRHSWVFTSKDLDQSITNMFRSIEININKLYHAEYRGVDGTFYAFESVEAVCMELQSSINVLIEFYTEKRYWERLKEFNIYTVQLTRILKELIETFDPGELGTKIRRKE